MQVITKDTQTALTVSDAVFSVPYNESLVHQAVTTFLTNARSGNSAQKTRSEVRGGGRKPWNQKGSGNARAGTIRSPLWRSGGVVFAAKKRDYTQKINKKMYRGALRSMFAELLRLERLHVVSDFRCETVKTKSFKEQMSHLGFSEALIIMKEVGENEYLASRNLINYAVCDLVTIDPVLLLKYDQVVITAEALSLLEEQLQ